MKNVVYCIAISALLLISCKSKEMVTSTVTYHSYETECLGKSMDGSQTLRVWASGRNKSDAVEQARKKAVYDVAFAGISAGGGECNAFPVIDEPNARKKHEAYFDKFFADGGAYRKYVTTKGQPKAGTDRFQGKGNLMYSIVVTVNRSELRRRFESDNIIVK